MAKKAANCARTSPEKSIENRTKNVLHRLQTAILTILDFDHHRLPLSIFRGTLTPVKAVVALIENESVPIRLAQCWCPGLAISNAKIYIFEIKYTETILSNSTRKLLWFEITKMLIAVQKINLLCDLL